MKFLRENQYLYVYRTSAIVIEPYGIAMIRYYLTPELLNGSITPNFTFSFGHLDGTFSYPGSTILMDFRSTEDVHYSHSKSWVPRCDGYDCTFTMRNVTNKDLIYQPEFCLGRYI